MGKMRRNSYIRGLTELICRSQCQSDRSDKPDSQECVHTPLDGRRQYTRYCCNHNSLDSKFDQNEIIYHTIGLTPGPNLKGILSYHNSKNLQTAVSRLCLVIEGIISYDYYCKSEVSPFWTESKCMKGQLQKVILGIKREKDR